MNIAGQDYRFGKMEPKEQYHVMRRLAPLLGSMGGALMGLLEAGDNDDKARAMREISEALGPLAEALADMPDERFDYVIDHCLLHVSRMGPDKVFHPIYIANPKGPPSRMFADIDALTELRLVSEVIKSNLAPFFAQLSDGGVSSLSAT